MSRVHDQLNERLESLLRGEEPDDSLDGFTRKEADELRAMAKTASVLSRYAGTVKPRAEFVARIQTKLEEACDAKYGLRNDKRTFTLSAHVRRWAVSGAIALVVTFATFAGGFVLAVEASKNTVPGQALYSVKLAADKVRAAFDFFGSEAASHAVISVEEISPAEAVLMAGGRDEDSAEGAGVLERNKNKHEDTRQPPASGETKSEDKDNSGKADSAPGHQSPAASDAESEDKDNSGKADSAPGHQPPTARNSESGEKEDSGKADSAPGHQSSENAETGESGNSGKNR